MFDKMFELKMEILDDLLERRERVEECQLNAIREKDIQKSRNLLALGDKLVRETEKYLRNLMDSRDPSFVGAQTAWGLTGVLVPLERKEKVIGCLKVCGVEVRG